MKKQGKRVCILAGIMAACSLGLFVAGCGGGDNDSSTPNPPVSSTRQFGDLMLTLSSPKSVYTRGENVPLTLAIKNVGTRSLSYSFGGCQLYGVLVRQGEQQSALLAGCQGCTGNVKPGSFAAGQAVTIETEWNQRAGTGCNAEQGPVSSGTYSLQANLAVNDIDNVTMSPTTRPNTGALAITVR